ncbi:MAG: hypothetical protein M1831_003556 [Alyxoria varia]|nr:MAG: hypothetical protein M1831_003556 [Alyxoria varia]
MITVVVLYLAIYIHAERKFTNTDSFRGWMNMKINAAREGDNDRVPTSDSSTNARSLLDTMHEPNSQSRSPTNQVIGCNQDDTTQGSNHVAAQESKLEGVQGNGRAGTADNPGRSNTSSLIHTEQASHGNDFAIRQQQQQRPTQRRSVGFEGHLSRRKTHDPLQDQMHRKHEAIRRQLRMLFVYPVCYFIVWILPFVNHVQSYDDYRAENPIFTLVLLSFASVSSIGTVDSIIFSARERPWKHISGSDGTILGSFCFWKHKASTTSSGRLTAPNNTRAYGDSQHRFEEKSVHTHQVAGVLSGAEKNDMAEQNKVQRQSQHLDQLSTLSADAPNVRKESITWKRGSV